MNSFKTKGHWALALLLLLLFTGCAAVDERNIRTITGDTGIKARILAAFVDDKKVKTLDTFVRVYKGHVYLVGEYDSNAQKRRVVKIAKKTAGVISVTEHQLKRDKRSKCTTRVNLKITAGVKGRMIRDSNIFSTNIDVKTIQCNVVLVGLVGTKAEIRRAVALARTVEGVEGVTSYITSVR